MGRPSLGLQARTVVGSTKISRAEERALIEQFGTVHAGLRVALNQLIVKPEMAAKVEKPKAPEPIVLEPPAPVVVPCRIHRRYKVVKRWTDRGQDWSLKRCEDCGYETQVPE